MPYDLHNSVWYLFSQTLLGFVNVLYVELGRVWLLTNMTATQSLEVT